jgi:hypothetical protein
LEKLRCPIFGCMCSSLRDATKMDLRRHIHDSHNYDDLLYTCNQLGYVLKSERPGPTMLIDILIRNA